MLRTLCLPLALLLPLASLQAATEQSCFQDACAEIDIPSCADGDAPLTVKLKGHLQNPHKMSITAWQLVANADWSYNSNHQVQIKSGTPLGGSGFLFASAFERELTLRPEKINRLLLAFGPRSGGHGFYDVAVEVELGNSATQEVQIDVKPGSCPNPVNRDKLGITPVAVVGSSELDVRNIDLYSVTIAGVKPVRYSFSDVTSALDPVSWRYDCTSAGGDGVEDLILKFQTRELIEALEAELGRQLFDGEVVPLPFSARLKKADQCNGNLSGQESIQIISKR